MKKWGALLSVLALLAGACSSPSGDKAEPASSTTTTSTSPVPERVLMIVSQNVLHGLLCDDGDGHCAAADRVKLFARHIEDAGCPDVVAMQEFVPWWRDLLAARLPTLCNGDYHFAAAPTAKTPFDVETILSALPTSGAKGFDLAGRASQRAALRVKVQTPRGPIVLVTTHTGTGADGFGNGGASCAESKDCPPPCDQAGSAFECQIVQLRDIAAPQRADGRIATLVVGDLNLVPSAAPLGALTRAGFVDSYHAAGRPECRPATGRGCTSGRDDVHLATLKDPKARDQVRVDHIFVHPTSRCRPAYGPATGLFGSTPATNGPGGIVWVSDHTGVELDLGCT